MTERQKALSKLTDWMPNAVSSYQTVRNYDLINKQTTSRISHHMSSGLISEMDVINCAKGYSIPFKNNKFIEEIFWRVYFRGYFETHPSVWSAYKRELEAYKKNPPEQYEKAFKAITGIECFDVWMNELKESGYLHNHTRMWFASIWIFTLDLPWQLGADLFMQYLKDADEASNTLSWRWVAGLHTSKKPYIARASNIFKYTQRFNPRNELNTFPEAIKEKGHHPFQAISMNHEIPNAASLIMFDNFLDIDQLDLHDCKIEEFYVYDFKAVHGRCIDREKDKVRNAIINEISEKTNLQPQYFNQETLGLLFGKSFVTNYIFTGYFKDQNKELFSKIEENTDVIYLNRKLDSLSWNYCKGGYFKLKTHIQQITADLFEPKLFVS